MHRSGTVKLGIIVEPVVQEVTPQPVPLLQAEEASQLLPLTSFSFSQLRSNRCHAK